MVAREETTAKPARRNIMLNDSRAVIDVAKALKLRITNHLSYQEIADILGVTKSAIHQALKPFLNMISDPQARQAYKDHKAEVLEGAQLAIVSNLLDPDKIEKASVNNLAYAYSQLDQSIRLERGQSTANVLYRDIARHESEIAKEIEELEGKLAILGDVDTSPDDALDTP